MTRLQGGKQGGRYAAQTTLPPVKAVNIVRGNVSERRREVPARSRGPAPAG